MKQITKPHPRLALTEERKAAYLDCLRKTGSTHNSSAAASPHCEGSGYMTFHDEIKRNPEFARQVEAAKEEYRQVILAAIHERAITGWDEKVFSAKTGKQMVDAEGKPATVKKFSDEALRLATRKRSLWGDEFAISTKNDSVVHTTSDSVPRLDLTREEVFALPESARRELGKILRLVAQMRQEAPEAAEQQAQELLEHQTTDATFEEIPESTSPREAWEDYE